MSDESLRAAAEGATPGPWAYDDGDGMVYTILPGDDYIDVAQAKSDLLHDARYIAAANPTAVLALIARVEAAEFERDHWKKAAETRGQMMTENADRAFAMLEKAMASTRRAEAAEAAVARVRALADEWQCEDTDDLPTGDRLDELRAALELGEVAK